MVDDSAGCFFHTPLIDLILSPTIGNRLVTNYATYAYHVFRDFGSMGQNFGVESFFITEFWLCMS